MGRDPGQDESYLESMRDAGRDPGSGHHMGTRGGEILSPVVRWCEECGGYSDHPTTQHAMRRPVRPSPASEAHSRANHPTGVRRDRYGVIPSRVILCDSCGSPDVREIAMPGPGGVTWVALGCIDCGYQTSAEPADD